MANSASILLRHRRKLLAVTAIVAVGSFYAWYSAVDSALTVEPAHVAGVMKVTNETSKLRLQAVVPLAALRQAANENLPQNHSFSGNGADACGRVGPSIPHLGIQPARICVGTRFEAHVSRGEISVTGSGDTVTVSVPVQVRGNGGFRGTGAEVLGLHAKNFAAEATATATVRFVVNPDWTTSVTVSTDLNWTSGPRVEIIGGVWVDIRSQVDGPAREALTAMAQNLQNAVPADLVSREVLKAWKVHRVPVSVAPAVYARLTPQNIGFSGLDIHDDAMHIGVMIEADTEVSTVDDAARSIGPLPPLARLAPAPGELSLRLPLRADYDVVKNALKAAFAGKTFQAETKAGKVTAKIEDVFIFPSNDRIVFGLKFDASLPGLIFDTAGTVFVSGKPVTENDGTLIRLTDVKFARQLDNDIWSLLSAVFEGDVKALIETKARVDLAPQIAKVVEDAKAAVADPSKTAGVKVTIRDTKAAIGDIALEEKSLAVMVKLDLGIDTQLQSLPLKAASAQ